MSRIT